MLASTIVLVLTTSAEQPKTKSLGGARIEKIEENFLASTQFPPHPEAQAGIPGCAFKA